MRARWLTPVLGAFCLVGTFLVGNMPENAYYALSEQARAHYHHNAVVGGLVGLSVSLAVAALGFVGWVNRNGGDRKSGPPGCLGGILALIASFLWLTGVLFPPYEF